MQPLAGHAECHIEKSQQEAMITHSFSYSVCQFFLKSQTYQQSIEDALRNKGINPGSQALSIV